MASTKFYLDRRGKAADGKGSILIQIFHNNSMTSVSTGIRVSPSDWDGNRVTFSNAEAINASLQEQKGKLDRAIALMSLDESFRFMTAADVKREIFNGKPKKVGGHLVSELFEDYISTPDIKEGTKEIYRTTLKKVLKFGGENLMIEQIDLKWLRGFEKELAKHQGINGRSIFLRSLRAICNHAKHFHINCPYPFDSFKIKQEVTRKRNITIDKLRLFKSYPTSPANEKYRDYFFLMFYLIGINTVDILTAKKSQIVNGRFEYIRQKTGKFYSIKIEPEAQALLDKYAGKGEYLLEAMDHCESYRSFAREINDGLKQIGEKVVEEIPDMDDLFGNTEIRTSIKPVIPGISTYFARHTWATIASKIGISIDTVSQAFGHSFNNRTTLIYIEFDQRKVDDANRKVIDYLFEINQDTL